MDVSESATDENNNSLTDTDNFSAENDLPLTVFASNVWKKYDFIPQVEPFLENVGPQNVNGLDYPVDFLLTLFDEEIFDMIVFQICIALKVKKKSNRLIRMKWKYKHMWSSHTELSDPYVSSKISLNRLSFLLAHLHLSNNVLMPKKNTPD